MNRSIYHYVLASLFSFSLAYGMSYDFTKESAPAVSVTSKDAKGFILRITFSQPQFKEVFSQGESYTQITLPGCGQTSELGRPELPAFSKLIRLPNNGGFSLEIMPDKPIIFTNIKIYPVQPLQKDGELPPSFVKDHNFYVTNTFYPDKLIERDKICIWREMRVAPMNIYPFQYNPFTQELKFYQSCQIKITYSGQGENEITSSRNFITESFASLYQALSIGPEGAGLDQPVQRGAYLIITPPSYYNYLQDLSEWKTRMGYYTYVASTNETGTDAAQIKAYIENAYENWEITPEFVILVGDEDNSMPTFYIPGSYFPWDCTDLDYALIEGDDYFPEVFVGRLSIDNSTELLTVLNKMFHYEKTPYLTETLWYDKALVIADFTGAQSVMMTKEFTEDQLQYGGYGTVVNAYYPGSPSSLVSQTINSGVTFVNYRGYGGQIYWTLNNNNWDIEDIEELTNGYKTPVVTSMVCGGGNFASSYDPCFGESWLREGSPTSGKGAIAFCGPSEVDTHTKWNNNLDCGIYWGIFHENIQQFGPALLYGKMELWLDYPHNREGIGGPTNSVGFYFYVYNILGDPGLRMWTSLPTAITANYSGSISLGMNQFTISLTDTGGDPISNAYVCIWKGDEIYEGGYSGANGNITLPMEGSTTGAMKLTVTGKNLIPLMSEINIVNSNVLLGIDHLDIIDTNSGTTSGNADSMLSPAETVELRISVKNFGTSTTATGITSLLSATSPRVTIIQGSSIIPNLTPGSSSIAVFRISLAPTLIVTDTLGLSLHLSSAQGNWDQTVWAEISDAEFIPLSYQYTPVTLEPGGEANLIITLNNSGLCNASNIIANLTSLDPLIQILSNNSAFGSIFSGDTGSNSSHPFSLGASSSAYSGRLSHLRLNFNTLEGYTPVSDLFIQVGTVNVSDPMGPDDYGYYCFDSGDTGYTQAPIYSWYDIHSVGTQLMLPDYNDEQDCRVLVNLPFTFTYYGENYTQISVCSNGFISMGNNDYVYFRNKAIPSAMGPPAMIAAFWDDLQMIMFGFDGKVYKYYQSSLHRFVIEYYNVKNDFSSVNECFEIMLYDPAYYPTPTGDGEIVFQYQDVHDYDTNDNYCTVGIEDYYHTTGLQYVFSAIYPPSSDTLADGLAIKFSTNPGQYTSAQLSLSFNPVNPPIIIPASGGSFSFTAGITNISSSPTTFDFWTEAVLPDGNTMSPIFLRTNLSLSAGASINRTLSQTIPAAAPPGQYLFRGLIGDHNTGNVLQYQEFNFTKLGSQ